MDAQNKLSGNSKYLRLLSKQYPGIQSVCTEIINLRAILNLPKGTEHFLSDLHGEYEAFTHILNNCSGVIKEKVDVLFSGSVPADERAQLCTLIYYPEEKLEQMKTMVDDLDKWYETTLLRLIGVCRVIASKYTRSKVRKALPKEYGYIIDELLHADYDEQNQSLYYEKIMESIIAIGYADDFIAALAGLIKRLAVDHLHIVGDIFDRGPRPDLIMDMLMSHHSVDIQWGNHDILWMGATAGSDACVAVVVNNCAAFGNLAVLEQGYGVNLRPLALFAEKTYPRSHCFEPKRTEDNASDSQDYIELAGKMRKAIAIIMLKLEGQLILRHPEYQMSNRLLLQNINPDDGTVTIGGKTYPMRDTMLPTVDFSDPYALTEEERRLIDGLRKSFLRSEKLAAHVEFLYSHGSMYKIFNQNLLYHGCIPMEPDSSFTQVDLEGKIYSGKALMDAADSMARRGYFGSGDEKLSAQDGMWYLWCGKLSPLFGRDRMTTFERMFVDDRSIWKENKNEYYTCIQQEAGCAKILEEFGLSYDLSHIINGHVPVKVKEGENPVKSNGKLIVIDGGFCKVYRPQTGIAGYTLIYNSWGMRLSAHHPFKSMQAAIQDDLDIHSTTEIFETVKERIKVMDTDVGQQISEQIYDLSLLLQAYRAGSN